MSSPDHFKGQSPLTHVAEVYAKGVITSTEVHGMETPGKIAAAADSMKDCSVVLLLLWFLLQKLALPLLQQLTLFALFGCALIIWKTGRSGWLGWSRLERLHRMLMQEKWEIENHRPQERAELAVLYAAKGFEGKLLEDVLDVLMADGDRLLKVMLQEEMGLSLETHDHPLLQSFGAFMGGALTLASLLLAYFLAPAWGVFASAVVLISIGTYGTTYFVGNRLIPAVV